MFDVGFSELVVIATVALIVLGPNRLPKVARTCGLLYGKIQQYVAAFKADIDREVALDHMKKATAEAQMKLAEMQDKFKDFGHEFPEVPDATALHQVDKKDFDSSRKEDQLQ